jgi:hypothetical protein
MMRDKSLNLLLMVLFGVTGIAVLALTWFSPIIQSERPLATLAGSVGLLVSLSQVGVLKSRRDKSDESVVINVEIEEK